jgi:hypothetical protein
MHTTSLLVSENVVGEKTEKKQSNWPEASRYFPEYSRGTYLKKKQNSQDSF